MARHSIPLPNYPEILLKERSEIAPTEIEEGEMFGALCRHYDVLLSSVGPDDLVRPTTELWARLGRKLVQDFVPAYRLRKRPGRPSVSPGAATDDEIAEYRKAGGRPDALRQIVFFWVQARFVEAVRRIAQQQSNAFAKLAIDSRKGEMPETKKLRATLPKRYRKLKTRRSFEDAWQVIPEYVRSHPESFTNFQS